VTEQVFIGAVDSTYRINFSNQQLYSAVTPDGTDGWQFMRIRPTWTSYKP